MEASEEQFFTFDEEDSLFESQTPYLLLEAIGMGAYSTVWSAVRKPTSCSHLRPPNILLGYWAGLTFVGFYSHNIESHAGQGRGIAIPKTQHDEKQNRAQRREEEKTRTAKEKVAIKKEAQVFDDLVDCKRILRELHILRQLNHPNVVKLLDFYLDRTNPKFNSVYLVLELADTSLETIIDSPVYLTESEVTKILYNVLIGLKYLHSRGILHRDVKPANLLVYESGDCKLCDFGLSRTAIEHSCPLSLHRLKARKKREEGAAASALLKSRPVEPGKPFKRCEFKKGLTTHVATRWYRAPELVLGQELYDYAVDVWGAGCIFAELLGLKKDNVANYIDRKPLFPSPGLTAKCATPSVDLEQLGVIMDVVGTPNESDCAFIKREDIIASVLALPKRNRIDFTLLYPGSPPEAIDLLSRMLSFNPYTRISIDEALAHPYLKQVRNKSREVFPIEQLVIGFESEGNLSEDRLRALFLEEFAHYPQSQP